MILRPLALLADSKVVFKSATDLRNLLISDFELVGLRYDLLVVWQELVLRIGRVERLEILIDCAKIEHHELLLNKFQDRQHCFEKELGSVGKYVVPDADAQTKWETIQKASLEPFVNPEQVWQILNQVSMQVRHVDIHQMVEYLYIS